MAPGPLGPWAGCPRLGGLFWLGEVGQVWVATFWNIMGISYFKRQKYSKLKNKWSRLGASCPVILIPQHSEGANSFKFSQKKRVALATGLANARRNWGRGGWGEVGTLRPPRDGIVCWFEGVSFPISLHGPKKLGGPQLFFWHRR